MMTPEERFLKKKLALEYMIEQDYIACEQNFEHYFKSSWKVLEPTTVLRYNWHHAYIAEHLMAVHLGQIRRLIINVPPRTGKSLEITVAYPTWEWIKKPSNRYLFGSYADTLARKHSILRRDLIKSDWYQYRWSKRFSLAEDQNVTTNFKNNKTGQMVSAGILGAVTGEGADKIIIDDPHNPKKAHSDAEREASLMAFDQAWTTRLNNKKTGSIIIVMQRLHEKDLTGHLLERNAGYFHLKIPQIESERKIYSFPISGRQKIRKPGELLQRSRDGEAEIAQAKVDLGSYGFAGQQQQDPAPAEGGMIKNKWWKFYKQLPDKLDEIIISMDTSFTDTDSSDYCAIQAWGRKDSSKYLLRRYKARMDFVTAIKMFKAFCADFPKAGAKIIEKKANGDAIINVLEKEIPGIIAYNPTASKIQRVSSVSPTIEAGNVYLPDPSLDPNIFDFIDEWSKFPRGTHDDEVDTATQALIRFNENPSGKFTEKMLHNNTSTRDTDW